MTFLRNASCLRENEQFRKNSQSRFSVSQLCTPTDRSMLMLCFAQCRFATYRAIKRHWQRAWCAYMKITSSPSRSMILIIPCVIICAVIVIIIITS
jgi:hypothetical protein